MNNHTPYTWPHDVTTFISRVKPSTAHLVLIHRPKALEIPDETWSDLRLLLRPDGVIAVWGDHRWIEEAGFELSFHPTGLVLAGGSDAVRPNPNIAIPNRPAVHSPSFPASLTVWCVNALTNPGDAVLSIGTIRGVIEELCKATGRFGKELESTAPYPDPPVEGWHGRAELTDREVLERFHAKIQYDPATGCHLWTGAKDNDGYGRMTAHQRSYRTHKFAYERVYGPIPREANLQLGHECGRRHCSNVLHIHPEPQPDNLYEMWRDRRKAERKEKNRKEKEGANT